MGTISKSYAVGDTVYVAYPFPSSNYFLAKTRTVSRVDVTADPNVASVSFSDGANVLDSDATQTVYTTAPLANAAIVTDVISLSAAAVASDATTSVASTSGQTSTTLGRVD